MFRTLGTALSKWSWAVLAIWLAAIILLRIKSPSFDDLAQAGEFLFLPESMASRRAEVAYQDAFPERKTTSNIVIVFTRSQSEELTDDDKAFIENNLRPALEEIRDHFNSPSNTTVDVEGVKTKTEPQANTDLVTEIHTESDRGIGAILSSHDHKASLATMDLNLDFQDTRNWNIVQEVEKKLKALSQSKTIPSGLKYAITGSATLGRDLTQAEADSARNTEPLTIALVIVMLAIIYRAPLLAFVPLFTLFVAVDVSLHLLARLAQLGYVPLFKGLREYATVISYGPGIDYCLFLIARYKENLEDCEPAPKALANAIGQVGPAIAASAATVICGIGMLTFAKFGKFHEAGIGISITLIVTLLAVLSLTPSMLFVMGRYVFWPKRGTLCNEQGTRDAEEGDLATQTNLFSPLWTRMGKLIEDHPYGTLLGTLACMLPFVVTGVFIYRDVSFGLLESLPKTSVSVHGANVLESHFPAGVTGPVQILLRDPDLDFRDDEAIALVEDLVQRLLERRNQNRIADIRSIAHPLGTATKASEPEEEDSSFAKSLESRVTRLRTIEHYVTSVPELNGQVTELEVILETNPFAIDSVRSLEQIRDTIQQRLAEKKRVHAAFHILGPTASVRDVNLVSQGDQWRIYSLVVTCVTVILVILLRSITISLYLIVTVLLGYLTTLSVTWLVFRTLDPTGFIGLDWTVPLFLFVVLIAVGEDYNIFLVTRIHQEQQRHGPVHGITVGLARTGGIITSCGIVMAGTFSSLLIGTLARMQQLGFALAFGVLLDTLVIRPILVPAFMVLLHSPRSAPLTRSPRLPAR